jgi:hypothetical protein
MWYVAPSNSIAAEHQSFTSLPKHQTVTKACFYSPGVSAPALCARRVLRNYIIAATIASSTSIGMNLDKDTACLLRSFNTSSDLEGEVGELRLAAELQRRRSFIVEISKRMCS